MIRTRPIQRAKQILRGKMVKILDTIPDLEKQLQTKLIHEMLFNLPAFQKSKRICCYCSIHKEVDTRPIIERIFHLKKTLFIPRYNYRFKTMTMELVEDIKDYEKMLTYTCRIRPQPKYSEFRKEATDLGGLNLIIANGLAFTKRGRRLGTGGGYYDTYIKNYLKAGFKCKTVGLAFRQQIFPYLPTHTDDVSINTVVYVGM